jgi:hypothetical protein
VGLEVGSHRFSEESVAGIMMMLPLSIESGLDRKEVDPASTRPLAEEAMEDDP